MLRKVLISSIAATALAGSALAADLPSRKAPPVAYIPPPVFTWTGLYVGVNAGGSFGGSNNGLTATPLVDLFPGSPFATTSALLASSNNTNGNGRVSFVGGGQIGYNWQLSPFIVAGFETDIQGFVGSRNNNGFTSAAIPLIPAVFGATLFSTNSNNNRNLNYLGTVRGRLGILPAPNFLLYATGGFAYGGARTGAVTQVVTISPAAIAAGAVCTVCTPFSTTFGQGGTRIGFSVGAGGEWMFAPNWSAKVEYLYYRLGGRNNANNSLLANFFTGGGGLAFASALNTGRLDGHIVRAGLNYHFNFGAPGPVVARY
jgi:outer membrane immunogenic protein